MNIIWKQLECHKLKLQINHYPGSTNKVVSNTSKQTYSKDTLIRDDQESQMITPTVVVDHIIHQYFTWYGEAKNELKPPKV